MKVISAEEISALMTERQAVHTVRKTLETFNPAQDAQRESYELLGGGALLTMPSSTEHMAGIKVLTMNPRAQELGTPMIQGQYLLFEGETLCPIASLDGTAITALRTPAVSIAGILDFLIGPQEPLKVAIFGTGPQGRHHEQTLHSTLAGIREVEVTFLSRTQPDDVSSWVPVNTDAAREVISQAELIICATSATTPILFKDYVREDAVVVALGSHLPHAREIDGQLMGAAQVILEDLATAQRECGDVIMAVEEGNLSYENTFLMREVVSRQVTLHRKAPIVFKFSGMGWEDLAIAQAIYELSINPHP